MLRHIDWFGLTMFNRPQMEDFIPEWDRLSARAVDPEARALVAKVTKMAREVERGVHRYLKFDGD
ncbi:MAG: hypothetical protein AAF389_03575 [Gemmatimonadota bacterium]